MKDVIKHVLFRIFVKQRRHFLQFSDGCFLHRQREDFYNLAAQPVYAFAGNLDAPEQASVTIKKYIENCFNYSLFLSSRKGAFVKIKFNILLSGNITYHVPSAGDWP